MMALKSVRDESLSHSFKSLVILVFLHAPYDKRKWFLHQQQTYYMRNL